MTYTKKWEWEHTWSIFSLTGMIVFSWIFILFTVPDLFTIYSSVSSKDIIVFIVFGTLWGVGGVLNGLAMHNLGMALAYPIVMGTVASLGALIPLLVFFPATIATPQGIVLILGTILTVIGIIFCSRAYARKEPDEASTTAVDRGSLKAKLALAVMAGVMSSLLNVGFAYSSGLITAAVDSGVSASLATNVAWALILTSGGCVNILYCLYLMITRKTTKQFFGPETLRNVGLGSIMGFLWCAGLYIYGFGVAKIGGSSGVVIGWVLFMTIIIIVGNLWGVWRGEWKDSPKEARALLNKGLIVLIASIVIVAGSKLL